MTTARGRDVLAVAFTAQLLALIGFKLVWPFLPLYLGELGVPDNRLPLWSGLLDFAEEVAMALAAPVWGVLGDRFGRKAMVVRAMLGGTLVILLITAAPNEWVVLALMVLSGLLTGVISPLNALVAAATPAARMSKVMGRMLAGVFVANTLGPLIGGAISDAVGYRGGFAIGAAFLAAAAVMVLVAIREPRMPLTPGRRRHSFLAQLRRVTATPGMPAVLACVGGLTLSAMMLYPIIPVLVPSLSALPVQGGEVKVATAVGLALGIPGVAGWLASWKAHLAVDRWGYGPTLFWAASATAALNVSLFFVDSFWYLVIVRAITGLFMGVAQVSVGALVGVLAPSDLYSTAYGVTGSVQSAATALGFLGGGLVGFWLSPPSAFVGSGLVLIAVAVIAVAGLRSTALEQTVDAAG